MTPRLVPDGVCILYGSKSTHENLYIELFYPIYAIFIGASFNTLYEKNIFCTTIASTIKRVIIPLRHYSAFVYVAFAMLFSNIYIFGHSAFRV
jgi:hypothetical protein